ncbi:MAG: division/cell wall cluster transcriptional repressor MraZ [Deltaproteobacteria bacterium]|nr:division/cell wall cluster transcriptional repressor MraZ [Deltaproteobacteria bacterium]
MFRGRYEHNVDRKGRTSLPARFREILAARGDERVIVTCGLDPCLVAYPVAEWQAFEERLAKLPRFEPHVVRIKRLYVSGAIESPVDRQGRILLPAALRDHAGIGRDVLFAGVVDHIEIWSLDRWREHSQVADEERAPLAKALSDLGL